MTPEEIRTEAIEVIARAQRTVDLAAHPQREDGTPRDDWATMTDWARGMYLSAAVPFVDALAEAGLLPTGVRYGVGQMTYGEPCCVHHTLHSAMLDRRAHQGPIRRQWTHDWQEVPE